MSVDSTGRALLLELVDALLGDALELAQQSRRAPAWRWLLRRRLERGRAELLEQARRLMAAHDRRWPGV